MFVIFLSYANNNAISHTSFIYNAPLSHKAYQPPLWSYPHNKAEAYGTFMKYKDTQTRPISDGFRKNNVNYWAFREIRSIIPHL